MRRLVKSSSWPFLLLLITLLIPCVLIIWQFIKGLENEKIIYNQRLTAMKKNAIDTACQRLRDYWTLKEKQVEKLLTDDKKQTIIDQRLADAVILASEVKKHPGENSIPGLERRFINNFSVFTPSYGFTQSAIPGYWQYSPIGGDYFLLFRREAIFEQLKSIVSGVDLSDSIRFSLLLLPDHNSHQGVKAAVGQRMPFAFVGETKPANAKPQPMLQNVGFFSVSFLFFAFCLTIGLALVLSRTIHSRLRLAELKNDMVATVSHELKTPLASSRILLETLEDNPDLDRDTIRNYIGRLNLENRRLIDLVEQFLTFSQLEKERYHFIMKNHSSQEIREELVLLLKSKFGAGSERISLTFTDDDFAIKADLKSLIMVLSNLIDNALKYSPQDTPVKLDITTQKQEVLFSVKDQGIGIEKKEHQKIFSRFYQVNQHLSREQSGCGLGLSIVKYIMDAHQASIHVDSKINAGTCFYFELPIMESANV